jgi:hypothetical protein
MKGIALRPDELDEIREMYDIGIPAPMIARQFSVNVSAVYRHTERRFRRTPTTVRLHLREASVKRRKAHAAEYPPRSYCFPSEDVAA